MARAGIATACVCLALLFAGGGGTLARAQPAADTLPSLTEPVNDFAGVIDPGSKAALDRAIRTLQQATGDVVIVATVRSIAPYGDIREYTVRLFENQGRGIGQKGKDNGLLILLAPNERTVWIETGYDLEQWITDGFAGETSRDVMRPAFRNGQYGAGLLAGVTRIASRIAEGRGVLLNGIPPPSPTRPRVRIPISTIVFILVLLIVIAGRAGGGPGRGMRRRGRGGWSGWSSGVGPFGGGWSGGSGGFGGGFGGFGGGSSGGGSGGGFGGFGGGSSGGGGGGASW